VDLEKLLIDLNSLSVQKVNGEEEKLSCIYTYIFYCIALNSPKYIEIINKCSKALASG
jgi:hypothetical protein